MEEDGGGMERVVKEEDYMTIAMMLLLLWFVALLGLMFCSEKELRSTFYSTRTGRQYNEALFRSGEDEIKMQVFDTHSSYNRHLEDEIKEWLGEKWSGWHETRPGWLSKELIEGIPGRLLPGGEDEGALEEIGENFKTGTSRRGSVIGAIGMVLK